MSIRDAQNQEIVRLGTVHSAVFKASMYLMPVVLGYFVSMVLQHDKEIARLKDRVGLVQQTSTAAPDAEVAVKLNSANSKTQRTP